MNEAMSPAAQLRSDTTFSRICNLGKFGNASALNLFCMIFMEIREQEGRGSVPGDGRTGGAGDQCGFIPGNRCLLESLTRGITILHLSVEQCDFTHSMSISLPGSHRNGSGGSVRLAASRPKVRGFLHWNASMVPLCYRKAATNGRKLLCAAAGESQPPGHPQRQPASIAPAQLLPGLFLAAAQLLW